MLNYRRLQTIFPYNDYHSTSYEECRIWFRLAPYLHFPLLIPFSFCNCDNTGNRREYEIQIEWRQRMDIIFYANLLLKKYIRLLNSIFRAFELV